ITEGGFFFEACDVLGSDLEIQPEWPLDGDFAETEVCGWKNFDVFCCLEATEKRQDLLGLVRWNFAPLVSQAFSHLRPERSGIDKLDKSLSFWRFAVTENPNVGGNTCVVKQLFWQGDERLQPVIF